MSHEIVSAERRRVYTMPAWPSDVLRSREFQRFFEAYRGTPFSVQTQDGWRWFSSPFHNSTFTVTFASRETLDSVVGDATENLLSKAFLAGDIEIHGEMAAVLSVAEYVLRHSKGLSRSLITSISRASVGWFKNLLNNQRSGALTGWRLTNCRSDLAADFYRPWLGPSLAHSCARFKNAEEELEAAQQRGMESICRVLRMEEDDRFLDLSCGWGSLLLHATKHHGVDAQGVTFCEQQSATVTERLRAHKVGAQCAVEWTYFADSMRHPYSFEKMADVGVFHQVATTCLRSHLKRAYQLLSPGGLLLLQRLTRAPDAAEVGSASAHAEGPEGQKLAVLSGELQVAESTGFLVRSIEDLGEDYHKTLCHWIERLQRSPVDDSRRSRELRSWLFYLLDMTAKLDAGDLQLFQILLSRPKAKVEA